MKLKYYFETIDMGDEIICVPVGANAEEVHGILKLNNSGKQIVDQLTEDTTIDKIVDTISAQYDNVLDEISIYVEKVIRVLRSAGLLEE